MSPPQLAAMVIASVWGLGHSDHNRDTFSNLAQLACVQSAHASATGAHLTSSSTAEESGATCTAKKTGHRGTPQPPRHTKKIAGNFSLTDTHKATMLSLFCIAQWTTTAYTAWLPTPSFITQSHQAANCKPACGQLRAQHWGVFSSGAASYQQLRMRMKHEVFQLSLQLYISSTVPSHSTQYLAIIKCCQL